MKYKEFLESLQEADIVARADYKVGPSGRKSHREIVFHDGSGTGKEDDKDDVKKEEVELEENAPVAPSLVKHRISVTVSDPDHPAVSKRKEKIQKTVIVTHSDNKEGARAVGEKYYKKRGYRVHDSHHAGMVNEEVISEGAYEKAEENKKSADAAKKQGDMFAHHLHMADHHDNMAEWHASKGRHSEADRHAEKSEQHHDKAMGFKEEVELEEAKMSDTDKQAAFTVHHALKSGEQVSPGYGMAIKSTHNELKRKYGSDWRKKAGIKEEVQLDEKFINGREYASQGVMHPDHAKFHKVGNSMDFYAHGTGDKISGKVTKNDGKAVHIQADKSSGGKLHKFKVTPHLPKPVNEEETEMKTYAQFMEQLLEYTPGPGGVTRHVGTYGTAKGAKYGNTNYDDEHMDKNDDDEKKAAPAAVKRGRGRPAGSKSGANQKVTSGKSYGGFATHSLHLPNSNK